MKLYVEKPFNEPGTYISDADTTGLVAKIYDEYAALAPTLAAAPALVEACKALHDALSSILEECDSPDKWDDGLCGGEMYSWIHRDQRAIALRAFRKSFKALAKIPGGME